VEGVQWPCPDEGAQDWGGKRDVGNEDFAFSVFFVEMTSQLMSTGPGTPVVLAREMGDN
jgi:hypothetical protein